MPPEDDRDLEVVEERLRRERPVPSAGFRSMLRSRIAATGDTARRRAWRLIGAYATSGAGLMAVATLGVAGVGPLSA